MNKHSAAEIVKQLRDTADALLGEQTTKTASDKTVKMAQVLTAARGLNELRAIMTGSR